MGVKIVAELSANHNHDINIARQSIEAAKDVGADAIKIQTYTPDTMTIDCDNRFFKVNQGTIWDGITLFSLYQQAYTPWEWHQELFDFAKRVGIEIFSTPFDNTAVDLLENLDCPIYKIASFEITDTPLIKYVASKGKPMILSVGIATLEEIEEAVAACKSQNNNDITLLQCTSQYPADPEEAELITMVDMKDRFGVKVGLSDHTMGSEVACIATAMGATLIEKHFILNKDIGGPDAAFSMNQVEFAKMVEAVRRVEKIMGQTSYEMTETKKNSRAFARSLFVVKDVKKGEQITKENVRSIRPGYGISPRHLEEMLGKKFALDICKGTPLSWDKVIE